MMKTMAAGAALACLLAGCATPMSPGADSVRRIDPDISGRCTFLRGVDVDGNLVYSSRTEAERDMLNKARNEVLRIGGNAFVQTRVVVERGFSLPFAQVDAYSCPR